jgi:LPXTG-motif cell wall-anchored protein
VEIASRRPHCTTTTTVAVPVAITPDLPTLVCVDGKTFLSVPEPPLGVAGYRLNDEPVEGTVEIEDGTHTVSVVLLDGYVLEDGAAAEAEIEAPIADCTPPVETTTTTEAPVETTTTVVDTVPETTTTVAETTTTVPETTVPGVTEPTCADYPGMNIPRDDPRYRPALDADGDGIACESAVDNAVSFTPVARGGELPRTGSTVAPWVAAGAALLLIGGALVALSSKGALLRR